MADALPLPPKESLREELLRGLRRDLDRLEQSHRASIEGATHEEAKPENSKDTRALEQSYLARGQAMRVDDLRRAVAEVSSMTVRSLSEGQSVAVGALVMADEDGQARAFFVAPHGGGLTLADGRVQVVTPTSPLGRCLLGRRAGDACELAAGGRVRAFELVEVI